MDRDMVIKAIPPAAHNDSSSGVHIFFRPNRKHHENRIGKDGMDGGDG